jgi:hypothetical protein
VGFRKLLSRQPAADPLEQFAEIRRKKEGTRPFAEPATQTAAAPVSAVAVDKKPALQRPEFRREGRRRSYMWLSQRSREFRSLPDQLFRPF